MTSADQHDHDEEPPQRARPEGLSAPGRAPRSGSRSSRTASARARRARRAACASRSRSSSTARSCSATHAPPSSACCGWGRPTSKRERPSSRSSSASITEREKRVFPRRRRTWRADARSSAPWSSSGQRSSAASARSRRGRASSPSSRSGSLRVAASGRARCRRARRSSRCERYRLVEIDERRSSPGAELDIEGARLFASPASVARRSRATSAAAPISSSVSAAASRRPAEARRRAGRRSAIVRARDELQPLLRPGRRGTAPRRGRPHRTAEDASRRARRAPTPSLGPRWGAS